MDVITLSLIIIVVILTIMMVTAYIKMRRLIDLANETEDNIKRTTEESFEEKN